MNIANRRRQRELAEEDGVATMRTAMRALATLLSGHASLGCGEGLTWVVVGVDDEMKRTIARDSWPPVVVGPRRRTITIELEERPPVPEDKLDDWCDSV